MQFLTQDFILRGDHRLNHLARESRCRDQQRLVKTILNALLQCMDRHLQSQLPIPTNLPPRREVPSASEVFRRILASFPPSAKKRTTKCRDGKAPPCSVL